MRWWDGLPFVRLLLPFLIGIISVNFTEIPSWIIFSLILSATAVLWLLHFTRYFSQKPGRSVFFGVLINLALVATGMIIPSLHKEFRNKNHFSLSPSHTLYGTVRSSAVEKTNSFRLILNVAGLKKEGWSRSKGALLVYLQKSDEAAALKAGDKIIVTGSFSPIKPPANPGEFDLKSYYAHKSIFQSAYFNSDQWLYDKKRLSLTLFNRLDRLREYLIAHFKDCGITGNELSILSALVLGADEQLDPELKSDFADSGAMHVLAVSGLHVGILYMMLLWLFQFILKGKHSEVIRAILVILCIWLYAAITGLSPSVVRAATMFSFMAIGTAGKLPVNAMNSLAASCFLLLLIDPEMIFQVGFQLSYAAVTGILLLYRPLLNMWYPGTALLLKIWSLTCVALAAQLFTLPLAIYYFHQYPVYGLISNLIVIPLAGIILSGGLVLSSIGFIPGLDHAIGFLLQKILLCMTFSVKYIASLPMAVAGKMYLTLPEMLTLFLLIFFLSAWILNRRKSAVILTLGGLFVFLFLLSFRNYRTSQQSGWIVYSIRNITAVESIYGHTGRIFGSSDFIRNQTAYAFQIENFRLSKNLNTTDTLSITSRTNKILHISNRNILIYGKSLSPATPLHVDRLLITSESPAGTEELLKAFTADLIILDSSLDWRKRNKWKNALDKLGISYHCVSDSGAWVEI